MKEILNLMVDCISSIELRMSNNDPRVENDIIRLRHMINEMKETAGRFVRPSVEEITVYMRSLNVIDPAKQALHFWNFYEARGWMIGKTKMKSWKAAVNTWDLPKAGGSQNRTVIG